MNRIYIFTAVRTGKILWTTDHNVFTKSMKDENLKYGGYIDNGVSGGPNISPFVGSNKPLG